MYRVVVGLGLGSLDEGFKEVSLTLVDSEGKPQVKKVGGLPANPELAVLYQRWKRLYRAYYINISPDAYRLEFLADEEDPYHFSESEFQVCCDRLQENLNEWLASPDFAAVTNQFRGRLNHQQSFQWIIESKDPLIQHLPWHLWSFFQDYPLAEFAMSLPEFEQITPLEYSSSNTLKILVILGKSVNDIGDEINVQGDRKIIESTPQVSAKFINRTTRNELRDLLWENNWDIILFAGHSSGSGPGGQAGFLIDTEEDKQLITIPDFKNAFQAAIRRGLKLVIFNSCDSFELGLDLMKLNLPQCVAMGEAIPDAVAQRFLRYLIQQWHEHDSFVVAVRNARTRLKESEDSTFPCASWLPVVCQNPAALPPTWPVNDVEKTNLDPARLPPSLQLPPQLQISPSLQTASQLQSTSQSNPRYWANPRHWVRHFAFGAAFLGLLCGARLGGLLESFELKAFDKFHQLSPSEHLDNNILLITISEADLRYQDQHNMPRKGSLSDVALEKLLETLNPLQPRAIAIDVFHDFEYTPSVQKIVENTNNFIAICEVGFSDDQPGNSIAPPPSLAIEQVGFSDLVLDSDDVARRQLLTLSPSSACPISRGLGFRLAQVYFGETIKDPTVSQGTTRKDEPTLKGLHLPRVTPNAGGYSLPKIEAEGYQIMTRYRKNKFDSLELSTILSGSKLNILQELTPGRLVIVGIKDRKRDSLHTPTDLNSQGKLTGMEIHAHMASQLIHAVEDDRALIWWWPEWLEYLWIGLWVMIASMVPYFIRNLWISFCVLGGMVAIATITCFAIFFAGGWIPFVPIVLGIMPILLGAGIRLWLNQVKAV